MAEFVMSPHGDSTLSLPCCPTTNGSRSRPWWLVELELTGAIINGRPNWSEDRQEFRRGLPELCGACSGLLSGGPRNSGHPRFELRALPQAPGDEHRNPA